MTLVQERAILAMQDVAVANALPRLDAYNAEFLLHMFDNVIGHITLPILAHVQLLKRNIHTLGAVFEEVKDATEGYIRTSSRAPVVKYVETIRLVRQSMYEAAAKLDADPERRVFTWKSTPGKTASVKPVLQKKKKK